jgi:hypothetical protein
MYLKLLYVRCNHFILCIIFFLFFYYEHFKQAPSTSKSRTISFVSSVPLREPTAQINFVSFALWNRKEYIFIEVKKQSLQFFFDFFVKSLF